MLSIMRFSPVRSRPRCAAAAFAAIGFGTVVICVSLLAGPAQAGLTDGRRPGVVLGTGLGLSPDVGVKSRNIQPQVRDSGVGVSVHGLAGFGVSNRDVFAIRFRSTSYALSDWDAKQVRGYVGPTYLHYFSDEKDSFVAGIGAGRVHEETTDYDCGCFYFCIFPPCPPPCGNPCPATSPPEGSGIAYEFSAGYEFSGKYQIGAHTLFGRIDGEDRSEWSVREIGLGLDITWF